VSAVAWEAMSTMVTWLEEEEVVVFTREELAVVKWKKKW